MRFKATFTDRGMAVLEKAFLPAFEKFGRSMQVLLSPDEVYFVQSPINTDGTHVTSRFAMDVLFEPASYKCQSKHFNLIAFTVDVALMLRVVRAAVANNADVLEVKLTQKNVPIPGGGAGETQAKPFLTFTGRGNSLSMVQEMPVSKPFSATEIDRLVDSKEVTTLSPFYLDVQPSAATLQSMVDRMRSVTDTIMFAACKNGDLHVSVSAINMLMGTQVRELSVYPQDVAAQQPTDRSLPAEQQLDDALQSQDALAVHVQQKHLLRALSIAPLTSPSQILCGVAATLGYVHIMYVFQDPTTQERYDESVHFNVRLPAKEV